MSNSLFHLAEELKRLEQLAGESDDGEIDAKLAEYLDNIEVSIEAKVNTVCELVEFWEGLQAQRKAKAKAVSELANIAGNKAERRRRQLLEFMEKTGRAKVETDQNVVRVRGNGGKVPVEIVGEVPDEFARIVTTVSPDRDKIREALEAGASLPFAKLGERGKCLVIQ